MNRESERAASTDASGPSHAHSPTGAPGRRLALFDALPELEARVPWLPLAEAPTKLERCTAIADYLGRDGVWVKRDDQSGVLYGGNKVRRFEFLLADARRRGARQIVTAGGLASTQVVATVLYGVSLGFDVTAVLFDQPMTDFCKRALLTAYGGGGRLIYAGGYLRTAFEVLRARLSRDAYLVLPGASTPLANLGYVDAMLELGAQVDAGAMPRPDRIVLPTGSGGTLAGLAVGAALLGWQTKITGVRITERVVCNRVTLAMLVRATLRFLRRMAPRALGSRRLLVPRVSLFHGAIGRGYGYATPAAIEAIPEVERLVGTEGEVTYSAKGLVGLRAIARANPSEQLLYWQTLSSRWPTLAEDAKPPPGFESIFEPR